MPRRARVDAGRARRHGAGAGHRLHLPGFPRARPWRRAHTAPTPVAREAHQREAPDPRRPRRADDGPAHRVRHPHAVAGRSLVNAVLADHRPADVPLDLSVAPSLRPVWVPNAGPQTLLVTCPLWDVLYGGARGGGKTDGLLGDFIGFSRFIDQVNRGLATWAGTTLRREAHARGLFVRRTYDELDEAVARSHEMLEPLGARWRPSKYTWALPWGGFLKMRYLARDADASRYQGHSYNWLGVDEAGNFASPDPIKKLTATLRDRNGVPARKRMSANPGGPGHGWLKADYVDPAAPFVPHVDPDTGLPRVYIPSRLQDNPALTENDPGYITRLRGSGP